VYQVGYEWLDHSMYAYNHIDVNPHPKVLVSGPDCKKPYQRKNVFVKPITPP